MASERLRVRVRESVIRAISALNTHTILPPDTPMPDVGLPDKSIYNAITLGGKDVSGRSLVAVTGHISNICFEIEIARRKMEILLDHFNSLVSRNVLWFHFFQAGRPLADCATSQLLK